MNQLLQYKEGDRVRVTCEGVIGQSGFLYIDGEFILRNVGAMGTTELLEAASPSWAHVKRSIVIDSHGPWICDLRDGLWYSALWREDRGRTFSELVLYVGGLDRLTLVREGSGE